MIAVRLYKTNPQGIPAEWPAECLENVTALPPGFDLTFDSPEKYDAYRLQHQAAYDAWEKSQPPLVDPTDVLRANAFTALKTSLQEQLGISVSSPLELVGKVDEVIPAARAKREGKPTTPERLAELERQVEMLTQFVVFLSRK